MTISKAQAIQLLQDGEVKKDYPNELWVSGLNARPMTVNFVPNVVLYTMNVAEHKDQVGGSIPQYIQRYQVKETRLLSEKLDNDWMKEIKAAGLYINYMSSCLYDENGPTPEYQLETRRLDLPKIEQIAEMSWEQAQKRKPAQDRPARTMTKNN